MADVYEPRPRKRWGRRLFVTFLVLVIIVGILAVIADRVGKSVAERMISEQVTQQLTGQDAQSAKPEVTVEGVPFITQVLAGKYQEIKILLRDFSGPAGNGKTIKMPLLDIRAKDVRASLDTLRTRQGDIIATTVTGAGTVDYATLAELSNQDGVKLAEKDGKLNVTAPLTILNQKVTIHGNADIQIAAENVIRVRFSQVTADGLPDVPLVQTALDNYAKQLAVDVKVPALPLKLKVEKVQPTAAGLVVTAGAEEVSLNAGGL